MLPESIQISTVFPNVVICRTIETNGWCLYPEGRASSICAFTSGQTGATYLGQLGLDFFDEASVLDELLLRNCDWRRGVRHRSWCPSRVGS